MPFAFYDRLSPARKRVYRKSAAILRIEVPDPEGLVPAATAIEAALAAGDRATLQKACQALVDGLNARLATPPVQVRVLARRPSNDYGELHGLYEPKELDEYARGEKAVITVWMRTAHKEQIVKFRTFLRTLVHEAVHHFDYELYKLVETFHTEGFYARESALMKQLLGEPPE
ncbi:hypothetical protein BWI17_21200 [Betaproteobacteria bacterium GR16-43]|nr:hypothetical protein BWI17_21200 [Betaproteobacteria bacterium GR16-43]